MTYILSFNYTKATIIPLRVPAHVNVTLYMFSYIILTIPFVSEYTVMLYPGLVFGQLSKLYTIYNETLLDPQDPNTIYGLMSFNTANLASNYMNFQKMNYFNFYDPSLVDRTVWVGIQLSGNCNAISYMVVMIGSKICQTNQFTAYRGTLFYGSPDFCGPCDLRCKTCVVN